MKLRVRFYILNFVTKEEKKKQLQNLWEIFTFVYYWISFIIVLGVEVVNK